MSLQKNQLSSTVQTLCKECNLFFGCESFKGYCSECFRKNQPLELINQPQPVMQKKVSARICKVQFVREINGKQFVVANRSQKVQADKCKCFTCNKKVGLLGVECKCSFVFCNAHRLPQSHECEINYKEQGKKRLQGELLKVDHDKIVRI